jgi:hypothetical protein
MAGRSLLSSRGLSAKRARLLAASGLWRARWTARHVWDRPDNAEIDSDQ